MNGQKLYLAMMAAAVFASSTHAFEPRWNPFFRQQDSGGTQGQGAPGELDAVRGGMSPNEVDAPRPLQLEERSLRAVLLNGANSYANVDGVLIRLGDTYDNWTLSKVSAHSAEFRQKKRRIVLDLQRPQSTAARSAVPVAPLLAGPESSQAPTAPKPASDELLDTLRALVQPARSAVSSPAVPALPANVPEQDDAVRAASTNGMLDKLKELLQ